MFNDNWIRELNTKNVESGDREKERGRQQCSASPYIQPGPYVQSHQW